MTRLSSAALVTSDPDIARRLSPYFLREDVYFPIFESHDWEPQGEVEVAMRNVEAIKRMNLVAAIGAKRVFLGACNSTFSEMLKRQCGDGFLSRVVELDGCDQVEGVAKDLRLGYKNPPLQRAVNDLNVAGLRRVAFVEQTGDIAEVIAENYCSCFGIGVLKIGAATDDEVVRAESLLRVWNSDNADGLTREQAKNDLTELLSKKLGYTSADLSKFESLGFFTRGLPYGLLNIQAPVYHFLCRRNLGLQILRGILRETKAKLSVALVIDPGHIPDGEAPIIVNMLNQERVEVVQLSDDLATVSNTQLLIDQYPYDFGLISSHAAELKTDRVSLVFSPDNIRKYDVTLLESTSISPVLFTDLFSVQTLVIMETVNGISWPNSTSMKTLGFSLQEFMDLRDTRAVEVSRACGPAHKHSNAFQLHDGPWVPALQCVGGDCEFPVIFNNCCSSFLSMAYKFVLAGTSAYIGTTKDISSPMATAGAVNFVDQILNGRTVLSALFSAQKDYINDLGYSPFLFWGHPEVRMSPCRENNKSKRKERFESLRRRKRSAPTKEIREKTMQMLNVLYKLEEGLSGGTKTVTY